MRGARTLIRVCRLRQRSPVAARRFARIQRALCKAAKTCHFRIQSVAFTHQAARGSAARPRSVDTVAARPPLGDSASANADFAMHRGGKNAARAHRADGAHVLRAGVRFLIDMMQRRLDASGHERAGRSRLGVRAHRSVHGASPLHPDGQFGLWQETGRINDAIATGERRHPDFGETIGRAILDGPFPHKDISVLRVRGAARRTVTVHVGVGYDIIRTSTARALGKDELLGFLIFTQSATTLEGSVLLSLSFRGDGARGLFEGTRHGRNVAHQEGRDSPFHDRRF